MKIHEYQAKRLLAKFGVPVPRHHVALNPMDACMAAEALGTFPVVLKAQIHAGGRGKGGGVKLAHSLEEVESIALRMLGHKLVTPQTGPEGRTVHRLIVEEGLHIDRELYLSLLIDRTAASPLIMASQAGGMEIEEVAAETPEKILREVIDPALGLQPYQARKIAFGLGFTGAQAARVVKILLALYRAFVESDASLIEINPFLLTKEGDFYALDAKVILDDNALYRHPDYVELRDTREEDPLETEASKYDLNYVKLDGTIGCMVNGAGLAMATMDIIKLAGGNPANFLDVGGGASQERVEQAFRILLSDPNVRAVLINIFGGIVRCDMVAAGVIAAARNLGAKLPIVVRLEGTNVEQGRALLESSGLNFTTADGMKDAAEKVVKLAA
ncbi:MAG: ADP-forming succinate--CoA ligase subunit beta [Chloracidobacterium sp.]|nr:ADP-forming succinate--CoA ligase subunit beta [Chloracidobacterium sp.]MDW8217744.1 ADP-forming succinate--CoA ligase subunit beta [Acidobacteriota bacterium]